MKELTKDELKLGLEKMNKLYKDGIRVDEAVTIIQKDIPNFPKLLIQSFYNHK